MEADLKVGCLITVLDYDLQIGVWAVRGEWSGGGRRLRYSGITLISVREHMLMAAFISLRTTRGFLSFLARCGESCRATSPEHKAHAGHVPRTSS
jgi:hypothetical protein